MICTCPEGFRDPLCPGHGDYPIVLVPVEDDTAYDPDTDEDYGTSRFFG